MFLRSDGQAVACKNLMETAAFRQHFFFDARCDCKRYLAALMQHSTQCGRNFLHPGFCSNFQTVFLRSDGQPVACKNLMDTAAFRQHFFLMPGVMVKRYLAALMQHSTQGGRNFLHPNFCRNFHTVFLRSDGQAVACKNLMDTAAFRQHFF